MEFKEIEVFGEGCYFISREGVVKRIHKQGTFKIIKHCKDGPGYAQVYLSYKNKRKSIGVHRLVALAFIPNPKNLPEVNHKNGVKSDFSIDNLEWVTSSENKIHAHRTGLITVAKGEKLPCSKLKNTDIPEIREMLNKGMSKASIGRVYNVHPSIISNIYLKKAWTHIK